MQNELTLWHFTKNAKRLQIIIFGLPLISKIFDHHTGIPFPPLGDSSVSWKFFAMAIVGLSAIIPYFLLPVRNRKTIILSLFVLFIISTAAYLCLEQRYVVPIRYGDGSIGLVTRGTDRVPALAEPYASMSDNELVKHAEQFDSDLELLYTKESLYANRNKLFFAYVLALVFLELTVGSYAKAGTSQ